jgi:hypothetical protein
MSVHLRAIGVCVLGTIAMAGLIASTTEDLKALTVVGVPGALQLPGIILIGLLMGLSLRSAAAATIVLLCTAIAGAIMQGMAIALAGFEIEQASVYLINRGTVQGFFALLLIFFIGMVGVVAAMLINVFARRLDI